MTLPLWFAPQSNDPSDSYLPDRAEDAVGAVPVRVVDDPDRAELDRLRSGDVGALSALFDLYMIRLVRFAAAIVGSDDGARDIVQDVFFRVWSDRDALTVRTTIRAYLFAATRGRALHALRAARSEDRHRTRLVFAEQLPGAAAAPPSPDDALERAEQSAAIANAMQQLTPRVRAVAELRWYGKMSYAEIAGVLGVSERTVNNQLTTAAKVLRSALQSLRPQGGAID